jgi:hypothetical protein
VLTGATARLVTIGRALMTQHSTHRLRQEARGDVQAGLQCVLLKLLQLGIHLLLEG